MLIISTYTISIILVYCISKYQYSLKIKKEGLSSSQKLSWVNIALFTLFFVGINYIYTYSTELSMTGDRLNYKSGYYSNISPSAGLLLLNFIGKYYNCEFNDFALLITLFSVPLVFIAYKYAKGATPLMLLFLLLTPYFINGFDNFKQTFTNGFSCLFFALTTYKPSTKNDILCILIILSGCMFHPTGFILIIFYAIYRLNIKVNNIPILFLTILLCTILMPEIMMLIAKVTGSAIPFLSEKILQYFEEDSEMGEGKLMIALKGSVYFYITAMMIINRRILKTNITNFSFYIIICCFVCMLFLLSYYNVWMPRMAELFFFPVMLCWAKSLKFIPNKGLNIFISCILTGFFTYRLMWMTYVTPIS